MGAGTFILAALKMLPAVVALFNALVARADAKVQRGLGYDQAVKDTLVQSAESVRKGDLAEEEARRDHAAKPGDDAFDAEFMRKD